MTTTITIRADASLRAALNRRAAATGKTVSALVRDILEDALAERHTGERASHLRAAGVLDDLRVPPANRLERLSGDRRGQHSIRINDQWRVCFRWREGHAHDVEIVDYH
jgi:proteic killer suppression protein